MRVEFRVLNAGSGMQEHFSWLECEPVRFQRDDVIKSRYGKFEVASRPEFHNAAGSLVAYYDVLLIEEGQE